uniref:SMC hinge domain-containing protein n=1 Tax=Caenorhabditis tropicalis TaxID=1561998 RepID=A0A1I7T2D2_9PELO
MPPKKSAAPPPHSDESDIFEEDAAKKTKKKTTKSVKKQRGDSKDAEEALKKATDELFDGSDVEDDGRDLFEYVKSLPDRPEFLSRRDNAERLMILNVEVNNFKSYYGKASIGPFHRSFTSIIGPNGSGKSNLIDSLLFVFGFRASKIRSDKLANLIHKSAGRQPDSCTVTIYFQRIVDAIQPDQYRVVPNSLFTIARTAYKNGNTSYSIDGRAASKSEVEARLRLVDIDIEHNRFLILQGEVEQIAMMKPVRTNKNEIGMVEYLEDIVGSNRIAPFTRAFEIRVKGLNCEVSQQRIARDHARSSKIAMEGSVRTAIEFLSKENEAKIIQMKLDQRRRKQYLDKVAPQKAEIEAKEEEAKALSQQLDANNIEVKTLEEKEKELMKKRSRIDGEFDQLTKEVDDLLSEETRRKETIKRYETDLSKTEADKKKEEKKKANFVAIPEKAEEKMKKWKEEIVQLTEIEATANAEADKNLEEFEKRSEKPKEEQGKIQEVWSKCNAEYNKIRSEATVARDEYEDMKRMANSGTKKLEDLQSRLVSSEEQHEKDKEEVERLKRELESCRSRKKDAEDKLPTVKEKARDVFTKLSKAREKMNELKGQNEVKSRDNVVKMLLKEKEAGRIPSFVGRLGEMGVVDKKYEKALSTNWPGKEGLEILIVENQEDCVKVINTIFDKKISKHAARSLELLKKNTIPQKLKPLPVEHYGAPRVFDIIDCEDNLKPAFYAMVKDTVIVDSYKEAVRLNKTPKGRGVSVSTLDGTVIAPSGNVTGGGERTGLILTDKNKKPKQVTQQDLDAELEAAREVNELQAEFDTLKSEEQNLDRLVRELRFKCEDMSKRLSILTSSIQTGEPAIETLKKTIKSLQKEAEKNRVDVEDLDSKQKIVIDLDKKRDKLREEADKLEKRQSEIQSELDGIFKELVQNHRDEAKDALQKRQKLEKDIAKETANVSSSARNIAKCDENIARFEKEIEKKRQLCDALQEKAVDDTAIEAKKETLNKLEDTRKELEKEAKDVTKKQSELSAAETQLEQDLKLSRDSISELKQKMACDSQMVKEIEKNLASMKINRIPRFQFLEDSSRPEDVPMHPEDLAVDENQSNEEVERQKNKLQIEWRMQLMLKNSKCDKRFLKISSHMKMSMEIN